MEPRPPDSGVVGAAEEEEEARAEEGEEEEVVVESRDAGEAEERDSSELRAIHSRNHG